jgi:hypothetical protein
MCRKFWLEWPTAIVANRITAYIENAQISSFQAVPNQQQSLVHHH